MTNIFDEQPQPGSRKPTGTNVIRDFLECVVCGPAPEMDFITIHWKYPGKGNPFLGKACRTVDEAVAQVVRLQGKGCDIWFGLSRQRRSDGIRDRTFHRELVGFLDDFSKRFTAWQRSAPPLDDDGKAALMEALYLCSDGFSQIAQGLDGR